MRLLLTGVSAALLATGLLAFVLSSNAPRSPAAPEPTPTPTPASLVRIDPAVQTVNAGSDAVVEVLVESVLEPSGLGSYDVALVFDPAVLAFRTFTNGPFLGSTGRSVTCLPPLLDADGDTSPDAGFVRVACVTSQPPATGPTGDGLLGMLTLGTSCAGVSGVGFALVGLSDPLGAAIATRSSAGTVEVATGPPCSSPSPTPTVRPTQISPPGDVDCSMNVNAIDAALILQFGAGLLGSLRCEHKGDIDGSGRIDAVDAALVLQYVAGLIGRLPP